MIKTINDFLSVNPVGVFALLAGIVAAIYLAAEQKKLKWIFNILPCVFWVYFIPLLMSTIGIFPAASAAYNLLRDFGLPASLFILFISVSLPDIAKLGARALAIMFIGSIGVVIGALGAMMVVKPFFAWGWLPMEHKEVLWKGVSMLSGSWIGGGANMAAVWESVASTPPTSVEGEIYSAMIAVDVLVAYSWMALLIALSAFQKRFDAWNKADTRMIEEVNEHMKKVQEQNAKYLRTDKFLYIIALAFVVVFVCFYCSQKLGGLLEAAIANKLVKSVIGYYSILIVLVTIAGLGLSLTPARQLEDYGASRVGYALLYIVLAMIGAKANLNAVSKFPLYIFMGVVWIAIHAAVLFLGTKLIRAPIFFATTASQANIGGPVSAPVMAAAYQPHLAVVGLLMAIVGNILGTFLALFGVGFLAQLIY